MLEVDVLHSETLNFWISLFVLNISCYLNLNACNSNNYCFKFNFQVSMKSLITINDLLFFN